MGNRIGVIFHNNWDEYSPLLYSHNGADLILQKLQKFLREYDINHKKNTHDGHLYDCSHIMAGFLSSQDYDIHTRVENLYPDSQRLITNTHKYPNYFEGGCWLINVQEDRFGEVETDNSDYELNNIVSDELINWR